MSLHQLPEFLPTPRKPAIPWTQWHCLFKNYLLASGSDAHPPAYRKALLLHCLGTEGQRLYYTLLEKKPLTPHAEEKDKGGMSDEYDAAVATLDAYFTSKTNVVVERHRFGQRIQLPGETTAAFVTVLRELALSCDFSVQVDDFIHDQLVAKTRNHILRERLLLEGISLTLEHVPPIANNTEEATKYSLELQSLAASVQKGRHADILFCVVNNATDILGIDAIEALRLHINRPSASTGHKVGDVGMACSEDVASRGNSVLPGAD
ncbi:uncharacterized protein LOC142577681 [Dermacentor variabilis]|uniref:uncharacterized protein LOC142577681 n=1 Tax=Dermacentor variabilis TaxID=34621 RepID=UPI003F5AF471